MKGFLLLLLALAFSANAFAAKRDFKGLFGSYQREHYTENEDHQSDIGMDIMLSTLIPVTPIVQTSEDGTSFNAMNFSTFFNVESEFFLTLSYNFEAYLNVGYYTYDTRKQNLLVSPPPGLPYFEQFEMQVIPVMAGIKYRLSTDDLVPYVGFGAGYAYVHRKFSLDYAPQFNEQYLNCLIAQALVGMEFFFSARSGIRLEVSAYYLGVPAASPNLGGSTPTYPLFNYQSNPWSIRYASGLFFLF